MTSLYLYFRFWSSKFPCPLQGVVSVRSFDSYIASPLFQSINLIIDSTKFHGLNDDAFSIRRRFKGPVNIVSTPFGKKLVSSIDTVEVENLIPHIIDVLRLMGKFMSFQCFVVFLQAILLPIMLRYLLAAFECRIMAWRIGCLSYRLISFA